MSKRAHGVAVVDAAVGASTEVKDTSTEASGDPAGTPERVATDVGRAPGNASETVSVMPADRYRAYTPVVLPDRSWPDRTIERAPRWCSVDLRDGNQALIEPMGLERKRRLFDQLVAMGFKEIEVGFPAAASTEMEFVRSLIDEGAIPDHVSIQVLTQARAELIRPTIESIRGARQAVVHLYNSTSTLQRDVVFQRDRAGIIEIATDAVRLIKTLVEDLDGTDVTLEYSPESFTGTELDFAIEICEAVMAIWQPTVERPMIINLPATVEMSTPNVYADQIEYMSRTIRQREAVVLSVHPHNDRGTAVAAAELALMAGADRVEGTLFGNGERTGNVDIVTLALNLLTQGVDPILDIRDINALVRLVEECNQLPVHPRHPYAGDLVFTAFSGSHQDAIKKGLAALDGSDERVWEVPYLPMDPAHVGRGYDELIRVNSQSGKGGVAFVLEREHGIQMPRRMQIEFQQRIQAVAESTGGEVGGEAIFERFRSEYLEAEGPFQIDIDTCETTSGGAAGCRVEAQVVHKGELHAIHGEGNGPIDALFAAFVRTFGLDLQLSDFREHALGQGSDACAMAYVEVRDGEGRAFHGAGRNANSLSAALAAVATAINRAFVSEG